MSSTYTSEKARRQAAARVRRFHRELIDAGLAPAPRPSQPPPPRLQMDQAGAFGRRRQAETVAPPTTLRDRLRDIVRL